MLAMVREIFRRLDEAEWVAILLVRVSVGLMFFLSGWGKLNRLGEFVEYFESLGIPLPGLQAPFVAGLELVGGALLVVGLATRIAAAPLAGTMVVAILTARLQEAEIGGLGDFLYLNEWLLILLLVWLVFSGAGRASLDSLAK